jgi:hypothetical protein
MLRSARHVHFSAGINTLMRLILLRPPVRRCQFATKERSVPAGLCRTGGELGVGRVLISALHQFVVKR